MLENGPISSSARTALRTIPYSNRCLSAVLLSFVAQSVHFRSKEHGTRSPLRMLTQNTCRKGNNVKLAALTMTGILLLGTATMAHEGGGFGGLGGFGGFGFGGRHGGFDGLGGLGLLGFGFFDPEKTQERFETRFTTLQTQYDDGVATGDDFFTTDEYGRIVDKTELLDDRYGLFVSGVERSIDRLGDIITIAQDDVTYFSDLLADYQADEDLSETRLARIEAYINRITDRLNTKIDALTEKQTTLQTSLPTYQSFQTELSTFLTDITAAGGGTTTEAASAKSLASLSGLMAAATSGDTAECAATSVSLTPSGVPEPATSALALMVAMSAVLPRRRR